MHYSFLVHFSEYELLNIAEVNLKKFCKVQCAGDTAAMVICYQEDASRYGTVNFDQDNKIVSFHEKTANSKSGWINSGIYYFPTNWFDQTAKKTTPISLEKDLIPQWLNEGRNLSVFRDQGRFIDIGTPESYIQFKKEADEKGQLYGAISKNEIINLLKENNIKIHSDDIIISEQIRSIGEHEIFVNPYIDIKESILIKVSKN